METTYVRKTSFHSVLDPGHASLNISPGSNSSTCSSRCSRNMTSCILVLYPEFMTGSKRSHMIRNHLKWS